MLFRSLVTSAIFAAIYGFIFASLVPDIARNIWLISFALLWSLGFLSILGFVYGRRLKKAFNSETGTIKWFDPSKGYGFLIRDKGGDLFVHLRSVRPEDRRKLRENTRVKFTVEDTEKGPQAEKITII
jgi:CspA family cold shock protein